MKWLLCCIDMQVHVDIEDGSLDWAPSEEVTSSVKQSETSFSIEFTTTLKDEFFLKAVPWAR